MVRKRDALQVMLVVKILDSVLFLCVQARKVVFIFLRKWVSAASAG
jgi:hypothetical protein